MSDVLPDSLTAGVTLDRLITLAAYPADDWQLTVYLRGPADAELVATADGKQHHLEADAATTAQWPAGQYWYSARVTDGTDTFEVEQGTLQVHPDLVSVDPDYDGRTHAEKTLAAVEAVIEGRATLDQERYRINNRELYRTPIAELLKLRSLYREEVRRQRQSGNSLFGRTIRVRF